MGDWAEVDRLEAQANAENELIGAVMKCVGPATELDGDHIIDIVKQTLDENGVTYEQ